MPRLTSLSLTIPDYKYRFRHDTARITLLRALLPALSSSLEQLVVSLDVAPLRDMAALPWPRLRSLTLRGADPPVEDEMPLFITHLLAAMPGLRSFSLLQAQAWNSDHHVMWPTGQSGDFPCAQLERLEISYPNPADEVYSRLPDTLRQLSLRCWPRHYLRQHRYERKTLKRRLKWRSPILKSSELLTILRRCRSDLLEVLEIEYREDSEDARLLRSLSELFPALHTLTVFRYRCEPTNTDVPVESIAQALSTLRHLRILRIHLDFPNAPHPLSPFRTYPWHAEFDAFDDFLHEPARTLATRLNSSVQYVCLLRRQYWRSEWLPFRIVRDTRGGGRASDVKEIRLDDGLVSIGDIIMEDDPPPYTKDQIPPGPDFIDDFEF
ncbi:hypothetical protein BN946_scf184921.g18 [Trametes cinnabarina]|uniref:F-box domain-containing protein n=1 Tax=Pycnoporus cinnabarinus TaxID=5643 RepID=A0A060SMJ8_PYCCI|nr:hypothetical protein BN946_scf184921.g18 [Trametes cinnabarina]